MLTFYQSLIDSDQDKSFFEELYHQHRHTMFGVAFNCLKDHHLAEDAVHDAFLRILKHLDRIRDFECNKMRTYFVLIVKNIAIDMLRRQKHLEPDALEDFADVLSDSRQAPDEAFISQEGHDVLMKVMKSMPQSSLDVLSLKMVYGFDNSQIAQLLSIPETTIRVRLFRGRKKLTALLQEGDYDGYNQ